MRKIMYNVEGTIFTSYKEAIAFKSAIEDLEDRHVDMTNFLEEIENTKFDKSNEKHRAKINEILYSGYSIVM